MKFYKQFLLWKNLKNQRFELVRANSLPIIYAKVPEKLKSRLQKAAKKRKVSQKKLIIKALNTYFKEVRNNENS